MPTVLITGANRGIGLELVRQYAAADWRVLATCRQPRSAGELVALAATHNVIVQALDVTDFAAIDALALQWQDTAIDVLVNNAGVFGPKAGADKDLRQSFGHMDYDIWSDVLRINLMAPVKMAESFLNQLLASKQKKIVTISSTEGSIASARPGAYAYRTSKTALNMAMASLAAELREQGVAVGMYCPGWVKTRLGGKDAHLTPAESVAGLRALISDLRLENSGRFLRYNGELIPW